VAALLAISVVAAACGSQEKAAPSVEPETPVAGGRIVEGSFNDAVTLNPILSNDAASTTVWSKLYDTLYQADPKTGELRPNLGTWTVSPDGLTYRWTIDAGARWSDGMPITGRDYATAVMLVAKSKKTMRKAYFEDIVGWRDYLDGKAAAISGIAIDPADPKKFAVTFGRVFCPALVQAFGSAAGPLPAHVWGKYTALASADAVDRADENLAPHVASGPFVLKEWRKGDQITLDRNATYWKGAPLIDQYVLKIVPDTTVQVAQLRSGELSLASIDPKDLAAVAAQDQLRVVKVQSLSYTYIGWNTRSKSAPALGDRRVRQALAYGLDMDAVVRTVLSGEGTKMVAHHPQVSWAAPQASALEQYAYDRKKAEQLIQSAGYTKGADGFYAKDGRPLGFTILSNSANKTRETFMQNAVEQYRALGVRVTPKLEAYEAVVDKLATASPEIEAWIVGWSLNLEPDPYAIWHSSQIPDPVKKTTGFNFGGYTAPGLDKLIEDARIGDCSLAARKRGYEAFNKILNEDQPYDFGFSPKTLLVVPKSLREFDPGSYGTAWNVEKWWYRRP